MPTQEERLTALEQTQAGSGEAIKDLNQYVTMLIGIVQRQEWDIREMKISLRNIDSRLSSFEQNVNRRFETLEGRFGALEGRFETLEKKFDQMLQLLTTSTTKPDLEI